MACSLVFSQSRVDFLDAFDESESSVPGTISMLFSILSAYLCAFLGRERVYDNEIGLFFLLFLSLFFILMFFVLKTNAFFSKIDLRLSLKPKKKRENLIMTSAISGRASSPVSEKLSNCEKYVLLVDI